MSRGRKTSQDQLEYLKNERVKKEEELQKVKGELQELDNKIIALEDQILLKEASESKLILSDKDLSLVEITKALKEGDFEYLKTLHAKMQEKDVQ